MEKHHVTANEWKIMELLWQGPETLMEMVTHLGKSMNWSKSTVTTMIRRMTEKEMIACKEENGLLVYSPLIDRESATRRETESFLGRVYQGSVSMMLSAFTKKHPLTQSEIDELMAILEEAKRND